MAPRLTAGRLGYAPPEGPAPLRRRSKMLDRFTWFRQSSYLWRGERLEMHPKSNNWGGYILTLGSTTYYHAGDTDHAPELSDVRADVAFVPIGGTYTMEVPEAAGLVKAIAPQIAVP